MNPFQKSVPTLEPNLKSFISKTYMLQTIYCMYQTNWKQTRKNIIDINNHFSI